MKIWSEIFDLFFPPRCVRCDHLGKYICSRCAQKIEYIQGTSTPPEGVDELYVIAHFKGPVIKEVIYAYKYQKLSAMTVEITDLLAKKIRKERLSYDLLAFVPISRKRKIWRGFNQSELLASDLGKRFKKPVIKDLKKVKETKTQVGLKKARRIKNLKSAFKYKGAKKELLGKSILLIDDVVTTGATLTECAKVLRKAGASKVSALVLAKE